MDSSRRQDARSPEVGSLTTSSGLDSRFIGSSSGVYFVNTVKRAFASSKTPPNGQDLPSTEDTIVNPDNYAGYAVEDSQSSPGSGNQERIGHANIQALGTLPPYENARKLAVVYFRDWHPLFPYLEGQDFLKQMELVYEGERRPQQPPNSISLQEFRRLITVLGVLNIAASQPYQESLSTSSRFPSHSHLFNAIAPLAFQYDIASIQSLLAVQLYLTMTMALRQAASVGGLISRSMLQAGLHRCPFRYAQLSPAQQVVRKRVFWSAYALDRYLSQALGLPLGISDTDVDVCIPTQKEVHKVDMDRDHQSEREGEDSVSSVVSEGHGTPTARLTEWNTDHGSFTRETILANFVEYGRLIGRVLELFHKNIKVRASSPQQVLLLRSEIDLWFNNLPDALQTFHPTSGNGSRESSSNMPERFAPFFSVLYQNLIILMNRPSLSLHQSRSEFRAGLQTSIGAARRIISTVETDHHMMWPGYLSSLWMAGLIIAFACQLRSYNTKRGYSEIKTCVKILEGLSSDWSMAQRCYETLSALMKELGSTVSEQGLSRIREGFATPRPDNPQYQPSQKRVRLDRQARPSKGASSPPQYGNFGSNNSEELRSIHSEQESANLESMIDSNTTNELAFSNAMQGVGLLYDELDFGQIQHGMEMPFADVFGAVSWESLFEQ